MFADAEAYDRFMGRWSGLLAPLLVDFTGLPDAAGPALDAGSGTGALAFSIAKIHMMNIGIAGSGQVGGTLGTRWAAAGHRVAFGSRHPGSDEMKALAKTAGPNARVVPVAEAVASSEIVLLATPWGDATRDALSSNGPWSGKILIDATNPLLPRLEGLELGTSTSGAELVAQWAPGARVVKAFNTVGFNVMADPLFGAVPAVMFYCGDGTEAKQTVRQLAAELGFDPQDAGPLTQARLLEPLALLWISLALQQGFGREIGFQLLRRG